MKPAVATRTVAIMQPYFIPYAGYFRLFALADVVVLFDCVQFPRRGWVHRNRLPLVGGALDWLTLSLVKCDRATRIAELRFAPDARSRLERAITRFPLLMAASKAGSELLERILAIDTDSVTQYLQTRIGEFAAQLGCTAEIVRSSELDIASGVHGQDRILAIAQQLGAQTYINASGGRDLYDPGRFRERGIDLQFFTPYTGSMDSILARLLTESAADVAAEIVRESILVP